MTSPTGQDDRGARGIPIFVDEQQAKVEDPAFVYDGKVWFPAEAASQKLLRCCESVRDIDRVLESLASRADVLADRRGAKMLVTPLHSLVVSIWDLFGEIEGNPSPRRELSKSQFARLKWTLAQLEAEIPRNSGTVRLLRDTLAAHVDKKIFLNNPRTTWDLVHLKQLLIGVRLALATLFEFLAPDIYAWSRESGGGTWALMTTDSLETIFQMNGDAPIAISSVLVSESPKKAIARELTSAIDRVHLLARRLEQP